jgi:hypothetical protein
MGALVAACEAANAPQRACGALARSLRFAHSVPMTGRPCKPGEDVKSLWRMLLPGTPFPVCGLAEEDDATPSSGARHQHSAATTAPDVPETKSD